MIRFDYSEPVNSCDNLDFEPSVQRAEDRARFYHELVRCKKTCRKSKFTMLYRKWACKGYRVGGVSTYRIVVTLLFRIVCVEL